MTHLVGLFNLILLLQKPRANQRTQKPHLLLPRSYFSRIKNPKASLPYFHMLLGKEIIHLPLVMRCRFKLFLSILIPSREREATCASYTVGHELCHRIHSHGASFASASAATGTSSAFAFVVVGSNSVSTRVSYATAFATTGTSSASAPPLWALALPCALRVSSSSTNVGSSSVVMCASSSSGNPYGRRDLGGS